MKYLLLLVLLLPSTTHALTFGDTSQGASANTLQQNQMEATHYTLSDANANVSKLSCYVDTTSGTVNQKGVIYNNVSAQPSALQANSGAVVISTTAQYYDYTLSVTLVSTGEYWLGVVAENVNSRIYFDAGAANSTYFWVNAGNYTTPPATWTNFLNSRTRLDSCYATYTTSAATTPNTPTINTTSLFNAGGLIRVQ